MIIGAITGAFTWNRLSGNTVKAGDSQTLTSEAPVERFDLRLAEMRAAWLRSPQPPSPPMPGEPHDSVTSPW